MCGCTTVDSSPLWPSGGQIRLTLHAHVWAQHSEYTQNPTRASDMEIPSAKRDVPSLTWQSPSGKPY